MKDSLANFLIDLALDPDRQKRYTEDPQGELDRAGLSAADRDAVLSRDSSRVRSALGSPDNDTMTQAVVKARRKRARKAAQAKRGAKAGGKGARKRPTKKPGR